MHSFSISSRLQDGTPRFHFSPCLQRLKLHRGSGNGGRPSPHLR